jgi:YXWGXW repeat-containing protein
MEDLMPMVRRSCLWLGALALAVTMFASPACASPRGRVYVRLAPPAPIVEVRSVAPGRGFVWLPGYYAWNGGAYVWTGGRWARPRHPSAVWVPGHWVRERRGWYFVEGRWR